jgi:hypothetical protein
MKNRTLTIICFLACALMFAALAGCSGGYVHAQGHDRRFVWWGLFTDRAIDKLDVESRADGSGSAHIEGAKSEQGRAFDAINAAMKLGK